MFDPKNFLKNPPVAIHLKQRLALEGIEHSLTVIEICYKRMANNSLQFEGTPKNIDETERTSMFIDAWSIIDQAHALILLILGDEGLRERPVLKPFVKEFQCVRELRNNMDHLAGRLNNLSKSEKPHPPIFGILSFVIKHFTPSGEIEKFEVNSLTVGSFFKDSEWPATNPIGEKFEGQVGLFKIFAFKKEVNLSTLFEAVMKIRSYFEKEVAPEMITRICQMARESGDSEKEALSGSLVGMHSKFDVNLKKT